MAFATYFGMQAIFFPFHNAQVEASGRNYLPEPKPDRLVASFRSGGSDLPPGNYDDLLQKHFGKNWKAAKAITNCESGQVAGRVNNNPATRDYSVGLFQINLYGNLALSRPSEDWLKVPENNIKYAANMSQRGKNWNPWINCKRKTGL